MTPKEKLGSIFSTMPISLILMNAAAIMGLLIGLGVFFAAENGDKAAFLLFKPVLFACWFFAAAMWVIFMINNVSGKYKSMKHTKWKDRPW